MKGDRIGEVRKAVVALYWNYYPHSLERVLMDIFYDEKKKDWRPEGEIIREVSRLLQNSYGDRAKEVAYLIYKFLDIPRSSPSEALNYLNNLGLEIQDNPYPEIEFGVDVYAAINTVDELYKLHSRKLARFCNACNEKQIKRLTYALTACDLLSGVNYSLERLQKINDLGYYMFSTKSGYEVYIDEINAFIEPDTDLEFYDWVFWHLRGGGFYPDKPVPNYDKFIEALEQKFRKEFVNYVRTYVPDEILKRYFSFLKRKRVYAPKFV